MRTGKLGRDPVGTLEQLFWGPAEGIARTGKRPATANFPKKNL
jgi:hypothetical protein